MSIVTRAQETFAATREMHFFVISDQRIYVDNLEDGQLLVQNENSFDIHVVKYYQQKDVTKVF